ncbi:MAG: ComEC family competence protein, partial [Tissierellia bacterium]|nr:ComEC family competence protein [Tissierellia bacterium]
MKRPFLFFIIPLIIGIVFAYYIDINIYVIFFLLIFFILIGVFKFNRFGSLILGILFFLLGILLINLKLNTSLLINYTNEPIELRGQVLDIKDIEEGSKYLLLVKSLNTGEENIKISEKIVLKIIGERKLELGDEVVFNGVLNEPLPNTNPRLFNYKLNLLREKIFTTTTIREHSIIQINKTKVSFGLSLKIRFTKRIENILDHNLSNRNSSIMKSIILGKYNYLEEEDVNTFRDLGLAHILAVSGLHIGIISGSIFFLFSKLGLGKKANIILTIGILWTYAYIIGNPSSVLRANTMFSLFLISQILHEPYDSINTLAFSAFILLIINPFLVFSLGFQLSYLASFFILYLGPKLNRMFSKTLSGIMAAQIGLFPLQAYYFNRIPLLSIIANLLFMPIFSFVLILSIILILFPFPYGYMGNSMGTIIDFLLNMQFKAIEIFTYFPKLTLKISSPSIFGILLYYLLLFIIFS